MSLIKAITNNTNLTLQSIQTVLTADMASGVSTLTVKNITGFGINQILVIGNFGNEGAEVIKTHASTAPTGSTITLASNTVFPHSSSSEVIVIDFDQVVFSHATGILPASIDATLATVNIVVDTPDFTRYNDTTYTTGYYFIQFKNSITSLTSDFSDPIPVTGYGLFSARTIIDTALGEINKETSETLTDDFAFTQIDNCQMEVIRELKRWSFMQKFESIIGQLSTGSWKVAVPVDLDDQNTNKSIYNIRIGREYHLTWVDKEKFDELMMGTSYNTLASTLNVGDATMTLTDSSDFDDSGTVQIGAYTYNYTANTSNVLTLLAVVPASQGQTAGADVFQGMSSGLPRYWTTYGGYIYYSSNTSSEYNGHNIYMDYYVKQVQVKTDSETIILPDPTVVVNYLCGKFLKKLNSGVDTPDSQAYMATYEKRKKILKDKEVLGKTFLMKPRMQNFSIQSQFNDGDNRYIRTGGFPNTGF